MTDSSSSPAPARAAGVLFVNPAGEALLLRRTDGEGWAFPGGGIEDGETAEQAARREVEEETGLKYDGDLSFWTRRIKDGVDVTTFLGKLSDSFEPTLNQEHDAHQWLAPVQGLALPDLHRGARIALARFDLDELGVAKAIRDGELTSPQRVGDCWLVALRITGTGASYRPEIDEFVWRDPALYLNDEFLQRCPGLPVILDHPKEGDLDSKEYAARSVGSVFLPYIVPEQEAVWSIAKVYDGATIKLMEKEQLSTSPMVETNGPKIKLEDGKHILLEQKPEFISHVAICDAGVWDKGGPPSGVQSSTATSPETTTMAEKPEERQEQKPDAAVPMDGEKLDAVLEHLKGLHAKHDALASCIAEHGKRLDAIEGKTTHPVEPSERPDGAEPGEEPGEKSKTAALTEERTENGVQENDSTKHPDSATVTALRQDNAALRARIDAIDNKIKDMPEDERSRFVSAQQRADRVAQAFGDSARRWLSGERLASYRRALAQPYQKYSPAWKDIDLSSLPDNALEIAETQIYADAWGSATKPSVLNAVEGLREITEEDRTGRKISKFYGDAEAVWGAFKRPGIGARINLRPRGSN
ncbi:MAG: NUDIX domain-containing protein [Steroidobacteraceae bacterium]